MKKVKVKLGKNSYEIIVGSGLLPRIGLWLKEQGFSGKAVIITDTTVRGIYADTLERSLTNASFNVTVLDVPVGEAQKTLEIAGGLYHKLAETFTERTTPILALGGGVVGDLAGFIAATYMRGVPLIQVPTTLLAMVDSSVGGKTAVDHGQLKNIVGAFYQPKMVVADIDTLKTLPPEELSNGMAEVIKHAAILDRDFFGFLEANIPRAMALDTAVLENILEKNVRIKADIVEIDERESGLRVILNYGHTIGHAVEAVSHFNIKHGPAVAIGMVAAAKISCRMGMLHQDDVIKLEGLIKAAGLLAQVPDLGKEDQTKFLQSMKHDKKVLHGKIRFILLKSIGSAFVSNAVDPALIGEVLFG